MEWAKLKHLEKVRNELSNLHEVREKALEFIKILDEILQLTDLEEINQKWETIIDPIGELLTEYAGIDPSKILPDKIVSGKWDNEEFERKREEIIKKIKRGIELFNSEKEFAEKHIVLPEDIAGKKRKEK